VTKKTKYRNRRLETLHKTAEALRKVDGLDKATMRDIEAFCLTKVEALSGHPGFAQAGRNQPGGFGASSQRRHQAGQRLGTRRQTSKRAVAQTSCSRPHQGAGHYCLTRRAVRSLAR
jgi:hypothetical protein